MTIIISALFGIVALAFVVAALGNLLVFTGANAQRTDHDMPTLTFKMVQAIAELLAAYLFASCAAVVAIMFR